MFRKLINNIKTYSYRYSNGKDINETELKKYLKEGAILVDVRSPQEYREGHLDGAILIPEYELNIKHLSKFRSKNEIIVLYCSNGIRSRKAQKKLEKLGYLNVSNLDIDLK